MKKRKILIIALLFILIVIDQVLKLIVIKNYNNEINYGIFGIELIKNTGMAFSLNSGNMRNIILESIVLAIIIRFIIVQIEQLTSISCISLCMLIAGGTSNLIDRIFRKRSN